MRVRIDCLLLALLLALALLAACAAPAPTPPTASEMLSLGERYLLELNYEQAVAQFLAVIEIEPMNARAYIGAAEAYIALGRTEDAIAVLERGLAATGDVAISAMLEGLRGGDDADESPESTTEWEENEPSSPLTADELDILNRLENALLAYDLHAAIPDAASPKFHRICDYLSENNSRAYKEDSNGVWMCNSSGFEGVKNYQLSLYTDSQNGSVYQIEYRVAVEEIDFSATPLALLFTSDITDGRESGYGYNYLRAYIVDGVLEIQKSTDYNR